MLVKYKREVGPGSVGEEAEWQIICPGDQGWEAINAINAIQEITSDIINSVNDALTEWINDNED